MNTHGKEVARDEEGEGMDTDYNDATLSDIGTVSGHVMAHNHGENAETTSDVADWLGSPSINYKQIHDETPSRATEVYELTMNKVENQQDPDLRQLAVYSLSWVLLARRRLSMKELQHIVVFELQGSCTMVSDDDVYEPDDIISACAGLITCVKGEVQLVHVSAQEFLNKRCDKYFPDAKLRVMETCIRYLITLAPLVPENLRYTPVPHLKAAQYLRPFPFASYASSQLGFHAFDVEGHERLNAQLVDDLFQRPSWTYLAPDAPYHPGIQLTAEMRALTCKILFFATFGLSSLLKQSIHDARDPARYSMELDLEVRNKEGRSPLFLAILHNHPPMVKLLLESGANASTVDKDGDTPLHHAAYLGHTEMITMLHDHGSPINARDKDGRTATCIALQRSDLQMLKFLVEKGADVNIPDKDGRNPMSIAVKQREKDVVRLFIENGGDINIPDKSGRTPIWIAVDQLDTEMVRLLIEKAGYINLNIPKTRPTLLHRAVLRGSFDVASMLLERGMDINSVDEHGRTPIWIVMDFNPADEHRSTTRIDVEKQKRDFKMVKFLIEKGANPNIQNKSGQTILHQVVSSGWSDIITILLNDYGCDVNHRDNEGRTALFSAAEGGQTNMIKLLLSNGANPSIRDRQGKTPLHAAARTGKPEPVVALLHAHSHFDVDPKDSSGKTPLLAAMRHKRLQAAAAVLIDNADNGIRW